jgi:hypothetical protein
MAKGLCFLPRRKEACNSYFPSDIAEKSDKTTCKGQLPSLEKLKKSDIRHQSPTGAGNEPTIGLLNR